MLSSFTILNTSGADADYLNALRDLRHDFRESRLLIGKRDLCGETCGDKSAKADDKRGTETRTEVIDDWVRCCARVEIADTGQSIFLSYPGLSLIECARRYVPYNKWGWLLASLWVK